VDWFPETAVVGPPPPPVGEGWLFFARSGGHPGLVVCCSRVFCTPAPPGFAKGGFSCTRHTVFTKAKDMQTAGGRIQVCTNASGPLAGELKKLSTTQHHQRSAAGIWSTFTGTPFSLNDARPSHPPSSRVFSTIFLFFLQSPPLTATVAPHMNQLQILSLLHNHYETDGAL